MGFNFLYIDNNFSLDILVMDWENRLKKLNTYDVSFEIKQGYYHIALKYDDGWSILDSDNENIYIQEKNGFHHYIASADNVKIDDLFNIIDATIEYNLDLQKKLILFKEKTEELQEIFSNEDYETLKTIEFKITKKEAKKKIVRKPRKKTQEKPKRNTTNKKSKTEIQETKDTAKKIVENDLNQSETTDYDKNDEVVVMSNDYFEELERK